MILWCKIQVIINPLQSHDDKSKMFFLYTCRKKVKVYKMISSCVLLHIKDIQLIIFSLFKAKLLLIRVLLSVDLLTSLNLILTDNVFWINPLHVYNFQKQRRYVKIIHYFTLCKKIPLTVWYNLERSVLCL